MIDLHNDALLEFFPEKLFPYLRKAKKHGVDEIWLSVWTTELTDPIATISEKSKLLMKIENNPQYPICRLHVEDAWFLNLENIECLLALKPHSVGLTWNHSNALAGGAHSRGGITPLGYEIIKRLEGAGIQIDTAHLNRRSFWQFSKITSRPLICTHTALNAVHRHPRNLTNQQIHAIIKSGGYIGLALVPKFLTHTTTYCGIYDLLKHIFYYKKHFSSSQLYWGTDFYGTEFLPQNINSYQDILHLFNTSVIGFSVLHQPILAYQIGNNDAPHRLLITGGMHAREWIGSLALKNWLCKHPTLSKNVCVKIIPCCNPDGFLLATNPNFKLSRRRKKFLLRTNNQSSDFSLWKANIHAVDLNVNFNAQWGQGINNVKNYAPANFIGHKPNSEPENRALLKLINKFKPTTSLAFHSKGNVIYYSRNKDQNTAQKLSAISGFPAIMSTKSFGGLTDYLALKCNIPSFTIELGDDKINHPVGPEHLDSIMPPLTKIIDYFLTGE